MTNDRDANPLTTELRQIIAAARRLDWFAWSLVSLEEPAASNLKEMVSDLRAALNDAGYTSPPKNDAYSEVVAFLTDLGLEPREFLIDRKEWEESKRKAARQPDALSRTHARDQLSEIVSRYALGLDKGSSVMCADRILDKLIEAERNDPREYDALEFLERVRAGSI